jgi:hypothetical protein
MCSEVQLSDAMDVAVPTALAERGREASMKLQGPLRFLQTPRDKKRCNGALSGLQYKSN